MKIKDKLTIWIRSCLLSFSMKIYLNFFGLWWWLQMLPVLLSFFSCSSSDSIAPAAIFIHTSLCRPYYKSFNESSIRTLLNFHCVISTFFLMRSECSARGDLYMERSLLLNTYVQHNYRLYYRIRINLGFTLRILFWILHWSDS